MKLADDDIRAAFREIADATPVPDRWDAIAGGSSRARRGRIIAVSGSALAVAAAIVVVVALTFGSTAPRFTVRVGAAQTDAVSVFPGGPTVALGSLSHGRLAFVSDSNLYIADADRHTVRRLTSSGDASALAWSADGEWLAFTVRDAPGYEDYTTWITRADGSDAQQLDGMGDTYTWAPSGHRLAIAGFCCTDSRRGGVFVIDPDHDPRAIAPQGSQVPSVAWSPDGATIGYSSAPISGDAARDSSVWTVPANGGGAQRVTAGELVAWTPDGGDLFVMDRAKIDIVDVESHAAVTVGASTALEPQSLSTWMTLSHQGDRVAIIGDRRGTISDEIADALDVCSLTAPFPCAEVATSGGGQISGPSFSPDGRRIAYVADGALWVADARVGNPYDGIVLPPRKLDDLGRDLLQGAGDGVQVTRGTAPNVPVWLSDGTILYHHGAQLQVIDPDGGAPQTIADPLGFSDVGAASQGLPGGQPLAEWRLTTH